MYLHQQLILLIPDENLVEAMLEWQNVNELGAVSDNETAHMLGAEMANICQGELIKRLTQRKGLDMGQYTKGADKFSNRP